MKKIVITFILGAVVSFSHAQKVTDRTISEICGCVKKIERTLSEDAQAEKAMLCMSSSMEKNMEALKKEHSIKTDNLEEAAHEIGTKLGMKLVTGCPEILPFLMYYTKASSQEEKVADINPDTLKLDNKVCEKFKSGKYESEQNYVDNKLIPSDPGSYTEFRDGFLYDVYQNNKYTTKWSIRWISGCEWEQTLIETTEPNIKLVMKKGDKLVLKAVGSTPEGKLWVTSKFLGMDVLMLLSKIK